MLLKLLSFVVCLIILAGLYYRRNRRLHARLMMSAFIIDMALVLYIELTRKAVETAIGPMHPFVAFHVIVSVVVVVLYLVQIYLGFKMMRKPACSPKLHGRIGMVFVVLRLANFVTSLFVDVFVVH